MKSTHRLGTLTNICSSTNITTGAWLQVSAGGFGQDMGKITYYNGSSSVIQVGSGKSGSEQVVATLYPGSNNIGLETIVPQNSRISFKALDANATSGTVSVDFFT